MGIDLSALEVVASERKSRSAKPPEERHKHITFSVAEFEDMKAKLGVPTWIPADFKTLLQGIAAGRFTLNVKK